ncbi:MAG: NAD(P)H-dependent oxidoreductase [Alphaproteobacteria bacterium]|nr:NAD(P)H-dependent oxidoreductase [Alphaproteobacteria bacterium]MDE6571514.1 NAD(P)H-dependent oxidoreductase [Alphaproteobacteria bacterium]
MKHLFWGLCAGVALCGAADAKSLVAYYSRSGNTATVAELIKSATDADIFEITTADANHYPAEYRSATVVAKSEIENGTFPAINAIPDLTQYDTVFVGTPCWWGTMAGPVHTFLTTADLSGKTVIPFNTHEGSGTGTIAADVEKLTPNSMHGRAIAIRGGDAANAGPVIQEWLVEIGK